MNLHPFYNFLKDFPDSELPGRDAQLKMSPEPLDPDVVLDRQPSDTAHPSSVLIPLFPDQENRLHVILTLRTRSIRHAGQISFPGGRREGNEELTETALRETEEEIGIPKRKVQIARSITPLYLHRTDNQITPFVGFLKHRPEMTPNPNEVEEAFSAPLDQFIGHSSFVKEKWDLSEATFDVPYWNIHEVPLWGATAMMLNELTELYRMFRNRFD